MTVSIGANYTIKISSRTRSSALGNSRIGKRYPLRLKIGRLKLWESTSDGQRTCPAVLRKTLIQAWAHASGSCVDIHGISAASCWRHCGAGDNTASRVRAELTKCPARQPEGPTQ